MPTSNTNDARVLNGSIGWQILSPLFLKCNVDGQFFRILNRFEGCVIWDSNGFFGAARCELILSSVLDPALVEVLSFR